MRVAVCPRSLSEHRPFADALQAGGFAPVWNHSGRRLRGDALVAFVGDAPLAVIGLEELGDAELAGLPALVGVAKYGVGLDTLDLDAMERRGIGVGWTPGVNRDAAAELAISLLIAGLRGLAEGQQRIRDGSLADGRYRAPLGRSLRGAVVGVVGCGHVGLEVVRLLRAFGAEVRVTDRRDRGEQLKALGVAQVSLSQLLSEVDAVSLHVPLDDSTRHLLDAAALARSRPGLVVVNVARGGVLDEHALLAALESGQVEAAGLDVLQREPAGPTPLTLHPRVLTSAHVGGTTHGSVAAMAAAAVRNLGAIRPVSELRARLAAGAIEPR